MNTKTRVTLRKLKSSLESLYGPRLSRVILYGSQARGDADRYSDIDVLVVLKGQVRPGYEIARTSAVVGELSLQTDNVITCLFMDEDRYLHRAGPLLRNIRKGRCRMTEDQQEILDEARDSIEAAKILLHNMYPGLRCRAPITPCSTLPKRFSREKDSLSANIRLSLQRLGSTSRGLGWFPLCITAT